jgi:hypothetical protein
MSTGQTTKPILPLILVAAGILILAAAGIWMAVNQSTAAAPDAASSDNLVRLTVDESHAAAQDGQAVILDVRGAQYYDAQHIAGALSIPLDELEARLSELDPHTLIITYCT